ncbi:hypothetical protein AB6N24_18050 [Cellulomonas sp. 179-A 4D5 NHS]|uniref:hypothetical protein n=1 Tax=Cellulomonas sp. 179-A 4D5 NHS TaxID=3142378 RepID=UPI00399FE51E
MNNAHSVSSRRKNRLLYWVSAGLLAVMVLVGLLTWRGVKQDTAADQKADEFLAVLEDAGAQRLPSKDRVVSLLGSDGGSVCQEPGSALRQATLSGMLTTGSSGPGQRPIITDSRLLQGQLAVVSVYCPEHLEDVKAYLDGLTTADVATS